MLAKDPGQRYATPGRAAQALQVFLVAVADPPTEPEPNLRAYLTWLETEGNGKAKPTGAAVPVVVPTARRRSRKHKRHRRKTAIGLPVQLPTAAPVEGFDVELVSMPAAATSQRQRTSLSRRDFAAFALGAGSVLLAILLGWAVALFFRKSPQADGKE
jgi:hypothetical protein